MKELTPKQSLVLTAIDDYQKKHGQRPTEEQVARILRWPTKGRRVRSIIRTLRKNGHLPAPRTPVKITS